MTVETPMGVLELETVFYAPLGEILRDGDDLVCCHLCGRWLRMVGSTHLRGGHGWTLAEVPLAGSRRDGKIVFYASLHPATPPANR
jgi:hypothetical protein